LDIALETGKKLFSSYPRHAHFFLPALQELQRQKGFLPPEIIPEAAVYFCISKAQAYEVVTFYKSLSLKPRGEKIIRVCMGTACHLRGAPAILEALKEKFGISPGETTENGKCTLETVNCLGACALAPLITINDRPYGKMTPQKLDNILVTEGLA